MKMTAEGIRKDFPRAGKNGSAFTAVWPLDLDLPAGAELDSRDSETPPYEEQSRLSAVVSVGPAVPDIKVGESSKLTVSLPGGLPYTLSELKSGAADKVSVDGSGVLTAKAEGKAEISGKLTVDGVSKEFQVEVSAYVP